MIEVFFIFILWADLYLIVTESKRAFKEKTPGVGKIVKVFIEIGGLLVSSVIALLAISTISILINGVFHDWPWITRSLISNFVGILIYYKNKGY